MTRDEIRLITFICAALAIGAFVKRTTPAADAPAPAVPERPSNWANPPYVFKSRAAMEKVKESVADEARP